MKLEYLVKEEQLTLKYEHGKGAWTYHIQIPNTKHITGKWGSLKVSGSIDQYKIDGINLFSIKGQDKMISINQKIRNAINKSGGDLVTVTLYLLNQKELITEKQILEAFKDAEVIKAFEKLNKYEQNEIIGEIISSKSEDTQIKLILKFINYLSKY